jgi:hypothetical protein
MRQRNIIGAVAIVVLLGIILALAIPQKKVSRTIVDVSWPNCKSTPATNFQQGIIGVTDGLDFRPNPCLTKESTWFGRYALYMNTGYPGLSYGKKYMTSPRHCSATDKECLAYNYGFAASQYGVRIAAQDGVYTDLWWLDVETDNSWTTNHLVNRASLEGAIAGIQKSSLFARVGIYSTPTEWATITGKWHNGLPAWLGTGLLSANGAESECQAHVFTGGSMWLSQYTKHLDSNVTCSGAFSQRLNSPDVIVGSLLSLFNQNHY